MPVRVVSTERVIYGVDTEDAEAVREFTTRGWRVTQRGTDPHAGPFIVVRMRDRPRPVK